MSKFGRIAGKVKMTKDPDSKIINFRLIMKNQLRV